mmetsp:Transcript_13186/g.22358  ORF Transcript_13186/g.22358 Transcript_13186/m.22358 type:complete len:234 (-) Transcript_13186:64-765(-)
MIDMITKNAEAGKQMICLELGSGRGGLARYITKELKQLGLLSKMVATNISQRENEFNLSRAKEEGLGEDIYQVEKLSFDEIVYPNESFDLVFCNDAFLHSANKEKLMKDLARILKKGGLLVFSDILESSTVDKAELKDIYARLSLDCLCTKQQWDSKMVENGLQVVESYTDTRNMERHYGMIKYSAQVLKRDQLLGEGGISKAFFDKQVFGLGKWIQAANKNNIEWGWFVYRK